MLLSPQSQPAELVATFILGAGSLRLGNDVVAL